MKYNNFLYIVIKVKTKKSQITIDIPEGRFEKLKYYNIITFKL